MAFGSLFLGVGAGSLYKRQWLRRHGVRTSGTVIRWAASSGHGGASLNPVVLYRTGDGRRVEVTSSWGFSSARFPRGTRVTIFYDPAKPRRMTIDGYAGGSMVIFCIVGVMAIAFGVWVLWSGTT